MVSAYRYDAAGRRLRYINAQPTVGSLTAHVSLDREGRHLFATNYGGMPAGEGPDRAVVIYALRENGGLDAPGTGIGLSGCGPNPARQERSHPHCSQPSPDGRFLAVADLGLDAVVSYAYGPQGRCSTAPVATLKLPPGAGPRHLAFHPDGGRAVVICELDSTVTSLRFDIDTGMFEMVHILSTVSPGSNAGNHPSDVLFDPNGRFVYGANRGPDTIVVLPMEVETGRLLTVAHQSRGGRTPRHLSIESSGRFPIVANQDSDQLSVFSIDELTGTLGQVASIPVGTPMCAVFFRPFPVG